MPEEPENASPNIALIIGIIALVGIGGGAYYYFKFVRGKKQKDEDLDFFDDEGYEEEPSSMRWVSQYANPNFIKTDFIEGRSTAYAKSTALVDDL